MALPTLLNFATESTGEVVNDALYDRTLYLEDKYKIVMNFTEAGGYSGVRLQTYQNRIKAGDAGIDLIIDDLGEVARTLSLAGHTYPLNLVDGLNLEADYWFPELNDRNRLGENLFFANSPISPRYYGSVYIFMFNRELAEDKGIENLYDAVKNGTWTLDKMDELAQVALDDLNGDGVYDSSDRYGLLIGSQGAFVLGADYHFVERDGDTLKLTLDDEAVITIMEKISSMFQKDYAVNQGWDVEIDDSLLITSGNYLFYTPCSFELADYRELEYDYGILPFPKKDEAQDGYYCYSQPWVASSPQIPISVVGDRLSMVSELTEAMTAYGYDYLRPAVYDNLLQLKGTRDEESAQIMDLIYENITFDLSSIVQIGEYRTVWHAYFTTELGSMDIVSSYQRVRAACYASISKTMKKYDKNIEELLKQLG